MTDSYSFGAWVRRRRRALDLTQDALALRVGCAVSMVRKIELDERRPSRQLAALLATGLELSEGERAAFLKAARAELASDQLAEPAPSISSTTPAPPPAHASRLPTPPTPLLGRANDLAQLHAIAARPGARMLTLTGAGGSGKTRLALQLAAELADGYPDGAVFVDLAPLRSAEQLVSTVAQLLGVRELVGTTLQARLCEYLAPTQHLLLLDNFEHLLEAAPVVTELLRAAPRLMVLVTSRVALRLSGEHEYPVPPLEVPPANVPMVERSNVPPWEHWPAVQLFVARAQAAQPAFALTEANAPAVAEICRRLDGLPLAIELAAARVKLFSPAALLARLGDRLGLLTSGARDLPARQQTLRAAIDWSYNLLNPDEQRLFWRLGVFVDGFTLEAAEAVCGGDGGWELEDRGALLSPISQLLTPVIDGLQALVDHSLVRQEDESDGAPRFGMLETIREYALERLALSGEEPELRRRHAAYFCALAEEAEQFQYGPLNTAWRDQLAVEYDNLHAALVWSSRAEGDPNIVFRLVATLLVFWENRVPFREALFWFEVMLAIPKETVPPELQAKAFNSAGTLMNTMGDTLHAEPLLLQALTLYESIADYRGCSEVLNHLGLLKSWTGRLTEAIAYQQESIQRAHQAKDNVRLAWAFSALGQAHTSMGQYELARAAFDTSLAFGVLHGIYYQIVCVPLAATLYHAGDDRLAIELLDEAILGLRADMGGVFTCGALNLRARIALEHGDDSSAKMLLTESLLLAHEHGVANQTTHTHYELGILGLKQGKTEHAYQHFLQSLMLFRIRDNPWYLAVALLGAGLAALLLDDRAAAAQHYAESVMMLRDWRENLLARQAALLVGLSGLLLAHSPDVTASDAGVRIWGLISALAPQTSGKRVTAPFLSLPQPPSALCDAAISTARASLGDAAFDAAWAAGQALTLDQAVAEALATLRPDG